jgi:hypothetical protein
LFALQNDVLFHKCKLGVMVAAQPTVAQERLLAVAAHAIKAGRELSDRLKSTTFFSLLLLLLLLSPSSPTLQVPQPSSM